MSTVLIRNADLISPDLELAGASLLIENGRIARFYAPGDALPSADAVTDLEGARLMPGFIDVHTHGRDGYEFTDGNPEHLTTMSVNKLSEGVTSWLPTTLTLSHEQLAAALTAARRYTESGVKGAKIPGVHLEGPFVNPKCLGAQNPAFVRNPDAEEVRQLHAIYRVLKISYAVEMPGGDAFAAEMIAMGVTPSCVHSAAGYQDFLRAYRHGLVNLSHFCNQMTALHHRDIGLVGAGLRHPEVYLEMICDKIHLCPDMISLIFQLKDVNHIQLVTDACQAAGMPDGQYEIGGLPLTLKDGAARLTSNGALAGSVLVMNRALKNVYEITGLPLSQLVKTTSYNQARALGLAGVGKLEPGFAADMVALDNDFNVLKVWRDGEVVR